MRLLLQWLPVLTMMSEVVSAPPGKPRVMAALRVLELLAQKSNTPLDDELIERLHAILLTKEGADLVDWIVTKVQPMLEQEQE